MRKSKNKRVIPGFGLSFGITITMLGLIVIIPLCSLVVFSAKLSFPEFLDTITRLRVLSSYAVSFFYCIRGGGDRCGHGYDHRLGACKI